MRPFIVAAAVLVATVAAAAGRSPVNTSRGQLALRGFDAVSYWTDGKPQPGSTSYEYRWMEAVWRFTSAEHRDRFATDPARYAPQFGGYCAYAVSRNYTADGDP